MDEAEARNLEASEVRARVEVFWDPWRAKRLERLELSLSELFAALAMLESMA
jgi:hypothetical protein